MASRSSSARTLAASGSVDGFLVWPAAPVSEIAIAAHISEQTIMGRMIAMLLVAQHCTAAASVQRTNKEAVKTCGRDCSNAANPANLHQGLMNTVTGVQAGQRKYCADRGHLAVSGTFTKISTNVFLEL